ncbi:MAG TPA: NAD-dependent epimerase/dehydratase family protein [Candidatus Paceibacterota bacterium]|nr:NAD-dependent epimerase/dehydratase family protein [Candidatus Paceibacterota bacterium]HMO82753.1 NAD-dependent epimerase/dehydratase family protein [Candidatus Paceibacterota bacterium]
MRKIKRISLLGASGYIGRSLVPLFLEQQTKYELHLFSRTPDVLSKKLVTLYGSNFQSQIHHFKDFLQVDCDVVLNATGISDSREIAKNPRYVLETTALIDDVIISKLKKKSEITYINFSSGAVHESRSDKVTREEKTDRNLVNNMLSREYYIMAKQQAEAKHRTLIDLSIVDVRVFAFFSRFVDIRNTFLMSQIASSLKEKKVFLTNSTDIIRDYITPDDLFRFIECVISSPSNCAYDVYSLEPVSKFLLLTHLNKNFGLQYEISDVDLSTTLAKEIYFSTNYAAKNIGYRPTHTSLSGICKELDKFLE